MYNHASAKWFKNTHTKSPFESFISPPQDSVLVWLRRDEGLLNTHRKGIIQDDFDTGGTQTKLRNLTLLSVRAVLPGYWAAIRILSFETC